MNIGLIGGGISCLIAGLVEDNGEILNYITQYVNKLLTHSF